VSDDDDPIFVSGEDEAAGAVADDTPADDAGSKRGYTRKLNDIERRQAEALTLWNAIFGTEIGRREMWGVLQAAKTFTFEFGCTPTGFAHPQATWAEFGTQQYGWRLFKSWKKLCPHGVMLMLEENDPDFKPPPKPTRRRKKGL
jgi:hypothetical protein